MSGPSRSQSRQIEAAIETFVRGFCFTRSRTHPYVATRIEGVWALRDSPRKNDKGYRREEWVPFCREPAEIDRIVRRHTRGGFVICAIRALDDPLERLRDGYKSIGYRLLGTEPLFTHDLRRIPTPKSPATIKRVLSHADAVVLGKAMRMKPLPTDEIKHGGPVRQYAALIDDEVVGWVSSVAAGKRAWCSNLFVRASLRRRGIGRALMARMLRDDRAAGEQASELLASHSGAMLYPSVGYRQIGELLLFKQK